ncbi:MAG: hypothetical protein LBQ34_07735, partial [Alphaproteobacteria bacterium]|nr:hypothetical protein [Alphaproteobacteria bacterium]
NNLRLFDTNAHGALLFKISVFIIAANTALYIVFRALGLSYPPFNHGSLLNSVAWNWIIFTWPMSFVLPLLVRHWSTYIILFLTMHMMVSNLAELSGLSTLNMTNNAQDPQVAWLIKGVFALLLVLIYAWIVKTYLRKPIKSNRVKVA